MKLTESAVLKLKSSKSDEIIFDDALPRFGVRLREGGSRKYVVDYRQAGVQRRYTIGSTATMQLEEARQRARKILVAVDDGRDPAAEKETKRAASGLIFAAVMRNYLEHCQRSLKPKTLLGYRGDLERLWKPLHKLSLSAVSKQLIAANLRIIGKEIGEVSANHARSTLSAFFRWAIGEGLCEINPTIGTNTFDTKPRDRVLTNAELAAIWKALPTDDYGRIVRLLLLTGQRRDEIGGLLWSEVNMDERLITLSPERVKNGIEHQVPLADAAMEVLQAVTPHGDIVFGRASGYAGWSRSKIALDLACGVKGWTLHDLRRTAATGMGNIGVLPHIIEAVLNHVSGHKAGVAGIYNRSTYATEKRAALDLWAGHIRVIVAQSQGANVTKLERKA